jgi:hypothetical protein
MTWKAVLFAVFIEHAQRRIVNLILWPLGVNLSFFLDYSGRCDAHIFQSLKSAGRLMKMSNFFIEKNNCSPPSLWHTDASYSALATIHFPNTSSILVIIRSAHWMFAAINLSERGLLLCPSIGRGISEAKWTRYGTQQR